MKYSKILLCFGALWASSAFPAPAPCDTLRVAFLTDIHVTPGNVQDSLFRVAVDEINASPCDIVIFGGDLTNLGSDAELEYVHGLISRLEKPWHAVPGNHETTWSESACTTFARIFGHDGRTAFRAGDYLFLGYASGPFMKMAMGAVRTEDLAWLAAEAAKARPGQRIVSLCHYPLNNDLTNRTEVTATLRRLDIPLTLFGHYHRAPSLFNFDSIAGIQGRALRGKSDSDAGYTLLDFWGDSVRVREKTLGAEPRTRFTIRMQDDPQTLALASDPTPPVPDYKAHAQLVLQDSATIYTGAAFYKDLVYYGTTQGVLRAYDKIYAKAYAEETALIDGLLLDLAMPRDIESTAAGAQTALFNLDDLGDLGDADDTSRETAECILDEETREFFAWLNYRAALPLIAKIKSAAIERVRHMRDYDALAAEGDAETLAELAVSRAVELVLGGMKEKVNVQSMKDCLEHIRKGSGR